MPEPHRHLLVRGGGRPPAAPDHGQHPQERGRIRPQVRKPGKLRGWRQHHWLRQGRQLHVGPGFNLKI